MSKTLLVRSSSTLDKRLRSRRRRSLASQEAREERKNKKKKMRERKKTTRRRLIAYAHTNAGTKRPSGTDNTRVTHAPYTDCARAETIAAVAAAVATAATADERDRSVGLRRRRSNEQNDTYYEAAAVEVVGATARAVAEHRKDDDQRCTISLLRARRTVVDRAARQRSATTVARNARKNCGAKTHWPCILLLLRRERLNGAARPFRATNGPIVRTGR